MSEGVPVGLPGWRRAVLGTVVLGLAFALGAPSGRAAPPGPVVHLEGEVARPGWYELGAADEGALRRVGDAGVRLGQELGLVGRAWAAAGVRPDGGGRAVVPAGDGRAPGGAPLADLDGVATLGALARAVAAAGGAPLHGANGLPHDGDRVVVRGGWALLDRPDPGELVVAGPAGDPRVDLNHASLAELEALPRVGPVLAARIVAGRPYRRLADLDRVKGVGPATLEQLRPRVRW